MPDILPGAEPIGAAEAAGLLRPFLDGDKPVVLAVSGGPDSVALMGLAAASAGPRQLAVATVDHGLRPESRQEAEAVSAWAAIQGLPHSILTWTGPKPDTRVQERARAARYDLLTALARETGANAVLTAHHLDDQAETVLMRLVSGSGIGGLAGMSPVTDHQGIAIGRPLLSISKTRLLATCDARGWPFLRDPGNRDLRFGRVRARRIMTALAAEGLTAARLARLAGRAARAEAALSRLAEVAFRRATLVGEAGRLVLDGRALQSEGEEAFLRALGFAIRAVVQAERSTRLLRLERMADELSAALSRSGRFAETLGGAMIVAEPDGRIIVTPEPTRRGGRP